MLVTVCYSIAFRFLKFSNRFVTGVPMAPIKLRDGEVTLYARGDSANWFVGFRLIEGAGCKSA